MRSGNTTSAEKSCQSSHRRHVIEMMEELVNKLAELQEERDNKIDEYRSDDLIITLSTAVDDAAQKLDEAKVLLSNAMIYYDATEERIDMEIEEIKAHIVDEWGGKKKTIKFDAGTLKFRTSGSIKINDAVLLMDDLLERNPLYDVVGKYIKGFNLTNLKKYMGVHELPIDVAEIGYKTTVKLESD